MIPVPEPALEALAQAFGTTTSNLTHFAGGREDSDGVLYAYPHQENRRLLKIMAIQEAETQRGLLRLEERLRFMRYLGENGAQIAYPRLSPQGNLYETHLYRGNLWFAYSMKIHPGKIRPASDWDPNFFRRWGQTLGQLHCLAKDYPDWKACQDPQTGEEYLTWRQEWEGFYSWCQEEDVKAKWADLKERLEALPVSPDVFGFVHNDPHLFNLLVDGERITLLDFDVATHHWFANDIAIACQHVLVFLTGGLSNPLHNRRKLHAFLGYLLEGYRREHPLSSEWLNQLDLFIAYRRILLFTVMQGWLQTQPKKRAAWKQMILSEPLLVGEIK
jgi:amicoumacin kinase